MDRPVIEGIRADEREIFATSTDLAESWLPVGNYRRLPKLFLASCVSLPMIRRPLLGTVLVSLILTMQVAADAVAEKTEVKPSGRFAKHWQVYWKAGNTRQARTASRKLVESGIGFEEAYARLARGRSYEGKARRGLKRRVSRVHSKDPVERGMTFAGSLPAK